MYVYENEKFFQMPGENLGDEIIVSPGNCHIGRPYVNPLIWCEPGLIMRASLKPLDSLIW